MGARSTRQPPGPGLTPSTRGDRTWAGIAGQGRDRGRPAQGRAAVGRPGLSGAVGMVTSCNTDSFLEGVDVDRDLAAAERVDLRKVKTGETCPSCGQGTLELFKALEVGHIFKLGTKYSHSMGAKVLDERRRESPPHSSVMGSYGIGVERIAAAAVELSHDKDGIRWPASIAPYHVALLSLQQQDPDLVAACDKLYLELTQAGFEVIYDDRDERPGVKFKDADLIGLPYRIAVGKKSLAEDGRSSSSHAAPQSRNRTGQAGRDRRPVALTPRWGPGAVAVHGGSDTVTGSNHLAVALDVSSAQKAIQLADNLRGAALVFKVGLEPVVHRRGATHRARDQRSADDFSFWISSSTTSPTPSRARPVRQPRRLGAELSDRSRRRGSRHDRGSRARSGARSQDPRGHDPHQPRTQRARRHRVRRGGPRRRSPAGTALAMAAGAHGLVCSSAEVGDLLLHELGLEPVLVDPRDSNDRERGWRSGSGLAPRRLRSRPGASLLVVGRPILEAEHPRAAAAAIAKEIEEAGL